MERGKGHGDGGLIELVRVGFTRASPESPPGADNAREALRSGRG